MSIFDLQDEGGDETHIFRRTIRKQEKPHYEITTLIKSSKVPTK